MSGMADNQTQAAAALDAHAGAIDVLHKQLASLPGCDRDRLAQAVGKYKAAHQVFVDDALGCVTH
jgi:hypothetical protein